ncbi:MAG: hypothetical protein ACI81T_001202, partial [Bacteroidia bacterium]
MRLFALFVFFHLFFGTLASQAQKMEIYQLLGLDSLPAKTASEWTIYEKQLGINLFLRYSESPAIQEPKMYLFIDRRTPLGEFEEYGTYKLEVPESTTLIEKKIHFETVGDYAVSYANADKKIIATDTLILRYDQKLVFAKEVVKGKPVDILREVEPSSTGLYYYYIYMSGSRRLQTHQIVMHVYKHDGEGFNEHIGEYKNYVNHSSKYASYRGLFLDPGTYKFATFKYNGEPYAEEILILKELE